MVGENAVLHLRLADQQDTAHKRADLFTFLFFFGKQTKMANITDADKVARYWAKQTATAISRSGGLQVLVALIALCFGVWKYRAENEDEDKRRERANTLDKSMG